MRWVGFVRNVMLGREGLDRGLLLEAVADAGGSRARSYLTTGNVTFDAARGRIGSLTQRLEATLEDVVSRPTMVAVREHERIRQLVATDPFNGFSSAAWALEVAFLRRSADPIDAGAIGDTGRTSVIAVYERELATARPPSGPRRPHVNTLLERASGEPATSRGWSTLCRIAQHP